MPHIDEGALHAYLDGALEEYPDAEAERVRDHLETCATCRNRLETERAIRDRAASILEGTTPNVDVPAFEELRSYVRARSTPRQTSSRRLYRLGWAASVVLALGTGWLLRGGERPPAAGADDPPATRASGDRSPDRSDEPAAAPARTTEGPESRAPAPERGQGQAAGIPAPPEPVTVDGGGLLPSRTEPTAVPEVVVDLGSDGPPLPRGPEPGPSVVEADGGDRATPIGQPEASQPAAASADEPAGTTERLAATDRDDDAGAPRDRRPPPGDVATSANVSGPAPGLTPFGRRLDVGEVDDARRDTEDDESYSLVVPNLEVLDVRFRGNGVRPEGQVVLQRLESGDTLRIVHLPQEIDPASIEAASPRERQITVQTATGWVVMRAPVSEDGLVDLMRRLLASD